MIGGGNYSGTKSGQNVTFSPFATKYNCNYDSMGNLTRDGEQKITLKYNLLNLPVEISNSEYSIPSTIFAKNRYLWNSDKLSTLDKDGNGYVYMGSIRYKAQNGVTSFESAPFGMGRIVAQGGGYAPQYFLTDHMGSVRSIVNAQGTVLAQYDYLPYGEQHRNSSLATSDNNDFRYNGKEYLDKFGINYYDSQARLQRTDGRFNSIDPLAWQTPDVTPYSYCAGNPIRFIDPDGREFTDALLEKVKQLLAAATSEQQRSQQHISAYQAEIDKGELSDKKVARNQKRIEKLQAQNTEIDAMYAEINELDKSDQLYDIDYGLAPASDEVNYQAATKYNTTTDAVTINVFTGGASASTLAHELKHAYQFETGMLSFNKITGYAGRLYDYQDEVEAFQRGAALGGPESMDSNYDRLKDPYHISGPVPAEAINDPNSRKTDIFRINRVTYK